MHALRKILGGAFYAALGTAAIFGALVIDGYMRKAHAETCTTNTPVSLWGQNGSNGIVNNSGSPGPFSADGAVGQLVTGDGVADLHGSAACPAYPTFDPSETLALAAALSNPIWLETGEHFALSGGLGFADGATAIGATGLMRFDKHWSGFAGGAVSTDDTSNWAGKAGVRVGW